MCFSGKCDFEDWSGNCRLGANINHYEKLFGKKPCIIGGYVDCSEAEEWYNANKKQCKQLVSETLKKINTPSIQVKRFIEPL